MNGRRCSPAFLGNVAGGASAVALVLLEYLRAVARLNTSLPGSQADLHDQAVTALLAAAPSVTAAFIAVAILIPVRSFVPRLVLGLPLALLLGGLAFIPVYHFSYIDIPLEEADHSWVEVAPGHLIAGPVAAFVSVLLSSVALQRRAAQIRQAHGAAPEA